MNLIVVLVFATVGVLILIQIAALIKEWSKFGKNGTKGGFDAGRYTDKINEIGKNAMNAVERGEVKKQLLLNSAQKRNSNKVLDQYLAFIDDSAMYKYLCSVKDRRYNGKD